jgi:hypothetical protein
MPEVHTVHDSPGNKVRWRRTPSVWLLSLLMMVVLAFAIPLGIVAGQAGQGGGRGGGGRGGGAPAAGAPAVPGAPPVPGGPAAAAPAGQGRGAQGGGIPAPANARTAAPVDLTGYWVSLVTEDYIERMFPDSPRSGVPNAGRGGGGRGGGGGGAPGGAAGGAPAAPAGTPDPCRVYGAAGSMRLPGRLNITWADDNTLKIDMDSGTQTRLLHFGGTPPPPTEKTLQGYSVASWDAGAGGRGGARGGGGGGAAPATRWASLTVVTTNMKGGYLLTSRSNYTENASLTEYFNRHSDFGADYMTVIAIIADPGGNHTTSSTFKKEPNGSKFSPTGCDIVK